MDRREFVKKTALASTLIGIPNLSYATNTLNSYENKNPFNISLSQWAFERDIFGNSRANYRWFSKMLLSQPKAVLQGSLDPTDIVVKAKELNLKGVDLVTSMIQSHKEDKKWLCDFKGKAKDHDVKFICLMADTHYKIGDTNPASRALSIKDHMKWIDAAAELECEHLRVNPFGNGTYLETLHNCSDSLVQLADYAKKQGILLTVENHGHPSSNGAWTNMLFEMTAHKNMGLFLDFGNFFMGGFNVRPRRYYDTTQGVIDLAPFASGISAKTRSFLENGNEASIDYDACVKEVMKYGFKGWMSAEYAGTEFNSTEGAKKTVALLRRIQKDYTY
ncbi:sugar phosphate isomerase/epimerase [Flavobacteriaceae bacterium]|nr:sugar phosphate isomerase/epimerase [Flavobacteriaceae bacterium]